MPFFGAGGNTIIIVYDDLKQAKFWLVSFHINSGTFLSKIVVHISSQDRNICETIAIDHICINSLVPSVL